MISHYVRSKIMGLFGTAFGAVKWGFGTNFSHIGRWLLLTIFSCIPIVNFIADGALMKVLKGEEPDIAPAGKSFVTGFFFFLIGLIYAIIPAIIILVLGLISTVAAAIVGIILVILLCLIAIPAIRQSKMTRMIPTIAAAMLLISPKTRMIIAGMIA